jgi:enoyl-CoA hydratase/carnithine racemase
VGTGKAKALFLTGDPINAAEAKEIRLVDRLVSQGDAFIEERKIAKRILLRWSAAMARAKETINEGINMPMRERASRWMHSFLASYFKQGTMKKESMPFLKEERQDFSEHNPVV